MTPTIYEFTESVKITLKFFNFQPSEVNVEHEDSSNWPTEEVNLLIDQTLDTNTRPDRNINVNQFTDVIG